MLLPVVLALLTLPGTLDDSATYQEGLTLYRELEFEMAIERFRAAADEEGRTDEERATLLVWESMARAGVGDDEAAKDAVRRALELDARVAPPEIAPPKVREFLEELRPSVTVQEPVDEGPLAGETSPPAGAGEAPPWMLIAGGTAAGVGVIGLAGASVFGVLTALSLAAANDRQAFQVDAQNAVDAANAQVAIASVLGLVGVALVGAGATLIALDLMPAME